MSQHRVIALNNNAGAFTSILASIPARRVQFREDEAATTQGLQVKLPNDNFTQTYTRGSVGSPDLPQFELGNTVGQQNNQGQIIAPTAQGSSGAFNAIAAGTYLKARSNTGTATNLQVIEDE